MNRVARVCSVVTIASTTISFRNIAPLCHQILGKSKRHCLNSKGQKTPIYMPMLKQMAYIAVVTKPIVENSSDSVHNAIKIRCTLLPDLLNSDYQASLLRR